MTVYQINQHEAWVLAILFNLPIQEGSVMGEWLGQEDVPDLKIMQSWIPSVLVSLEQKGYYDPGKVDGRLQKDLLDALLIATIGQTQLFTILRTSEQGVSTRFAMGGIGLSQYGFEDNLLVLHAPRKLESLVPVFLPDWLKVEVFEKAKIKLPLGAFLFFKQACLLADMAFVINEDGNQHFTRVDLVDSFMKSNGWIDVYHAMGLENAESLTDLPLASYLQTLLVTQYLEEEPDGYLKLGSAGLPLYKTLSDPEMISITLGMKSISKNRTENTSFFYGNKRLFRLNMISNGVEVEQMENVAVGHQWLRDLLTPQGVVNHAKPVESPPTIQPVKQQSISEDNRVNWQITILDGTLMNKTYSLSGDFTIGRGEQNNLTLLDGIASRKHALFTKTEGGYEISDLGSSNGTFLNGEKINAPVSVWEGDLVLIGGTNLRISGASKPPEADIMSAPTIFRS